MGQGMKKATDPMLTKDPRTVAQELIDRNGTAQALSLARRRAGATLDEGRHAFYLEVAEQVLTLLGRTR